MICTQAVLQDALQKYHSYKPTASLHLIAVRERWIPVKVDPAYETSIRAHAEAVLIGNGDLVMGGYRTLSQEHRIAVVLCLVQGWANELRRLRDSGVREERLLTGRVYDWLSKISIDAVALAVRNDSFDLVLIQDLRLTKVSSFMKVFLRIRNHWAKIGLDQERKHREEIAQGVLST